jgi:hypothetical protein
MGNYTQIILFFILARPECQELFLEAENRKRYLIQTVRRLEDSPACTTLWQKKEIVIQ